MGLTHASVEYAVPQAIVDAAPEGFVYRHFAFFSRLTGCWLGEVAGYVPYPDVPDRFGDARRQRALARWQLAAIRGLGTRYPVIDEIWSDAFSRVPSEQQVALDVTRFAWPVGDHVWHRWNDIERLLDWPESSGRRFIEIDVRALIAEGRSREGMTLPVVAQQRSHRPIRNAVPGQHVIDLTGTAYEPYWGWIWGHFIYGGDRWRFEPRIVRRRNRCIDELWTAPAPVRRQLSEAPMDLDLFDQLRDSSRSTGLNCRKRSWSRSATATRISGRSWEGVEREVIPLIERTA